MEKQLWLFWFFWSESNAFDLKASIRQTLRLNVKHIKHSMKSFNRISYSQLNIWTRKWTNCSIVNRVALLETEDGRYREHRTLVARSTYTHIHSHKWNTKKRQRPVNKVCTATLCRAKKRILSVAVVVFLSLSAFDDVCICVFVCSVDVLLAENVNVGLSHVPKLIRNPYNLPLFVVWLLFCWNAWWSVI